MKKCLKCGKEVNEDALFCQSCGTKVEEKTGTINEKKPDILLIILSFFVPLLGLILYLVEPEETKYVAKPYLYAAILAVLIPLVLSVLLGLIIMSMGAFY